MELLVITGTMGSGKTSVLGEASDILRLRRIVHAAIDLDAFGLAYLPSATADTVMYRNLQSAAESYTSLGVTRILLARAIETTRELELCRKATGANSIIVCRLTASLNTMQERVKLRDSGVLMQEYIARVTELNVMLDRARLEHFAISTENRSVTDAAREMLLRARWIAD